MKAHQNIQHLREFQGALNNINSVKPNDGLTIDNLDDDIPNVLYYVNGEEVFKERITPRSKLKDEFERIFKNVREEIKKDIKQFFNSNGLKGKSGRIASKNLAAKSKHGLKPQTKRYDFRISDDGNSVALIEHFDLLDGNSGLPTYIGVTGCTIDYNNAQHYEAVYHKTIYTGSEELDKEIISHHNIEYSNGKPRDLIEDEIECALLVADLIPHIHAPGYNPWGSLASLFSKVFPSDSHAPGSDTFDYKKDEDLLPKHKPERERQFNQYDWHPVTLFAAFVGLPNRCKLGEEPSWENLFWQFLGWEHNKSDAINYDLILFSVIKNFIVVLLTLPGNILRLFTEFLPLAAVEACKLAEQFANRKYLASRDETALAFYVLSSFAQFFRFAFESIYLIGRAVTSPVESLSAALQYNVYENAKDKKNSLVKLCINILVKTLLGLLSAAITATVYTLCLPLLFKLIPMMGPEIAAFAVKVGNFLAPVLTTLGEGLAASLAMIGIELSPVLAGFAVSIFSASILAIPCKKFINHCIRLWRTIEILDEKNVEGELPPDNDLDQGVKMRKSLRKPGYQPVNEDNQKEVSDYLLKMSSILSDTEESSQEIDLNLGNNNTASAHKTDNRGYFK